MSAHASPSPAARSRSVRLATQECGAGPDSAQLAAADQLLSTIARIRRAGRRQAGRPAELRSLTGAQQELLRVVSRRPGVSVADAAAELRLAPNTVSTLVGSLSQQGLLVRGVSESDRRVVRLELSGVIREQIDAWRDRRVVALAAAVGALPLGEQERLLEATAILADVAELLDAGDAPS